MKNLRLVVAAAGAALALASSRASASKSRPLFEPTDLEMEEAGTLEIDTQLGMLRSADGPARVVVPDFEVDLGISRRLELDVDGAYAIEGPEAGAFAFDHAAPDDLWVAAKLGLVDERDEAHGSAWAAGLQLGPKLPVSRGSRGVGVEGLALLARKRGHATVVLNAGGLVDPGTEGAAGRPRGLETGVDLNVDLDDDGVFALTGELAGVRFLSDDPHQAHATSGLAWSPAGWCQVSVVGLVGLLEGGDRYGLLLGFSPKLALLH